MANGGTRVVADTLRRIAFGAIGGGYTAIGGVLENPVRLLSIKNNTNQALVFSYNGIDDQEYIPAQTGIVLDFTSNSSPQKFPFISAGTTIYVDDDGVAPTTGLVAVSAYYCAGD